MVAAGVLRAGDAAARTVRYQDLPPGIARRFDSATFDARIRVIEADTMRRERDGELEHLIYFALQSQRFTWLARIEPAVSAKEYVDSGEVPGAARARLREFLHALAGTAGDERMRYFRSLLDESERRVEFLEAEYRRVMRFLYAKEFDRRDGVYQTRGHSTDTQVEANYAVATGLAVLKSMAPGLRVEHVLIVGPGMDFAPRTALVDSVAPQSFQPYAVADALLSLGLTRNARLEIDCADINARVVEFIQRFPEGERRLELYSEPGDAEYERFFSRLGSVIGKSTTHAPMTKTLMVDLDVARAVHAQSMNILTERRAKRYDLVVATNVLLYFNSDELSLALANISAMMAAGGYFMHNEVRGEIDEVSALAGLAPMQARTLRITEGRRAPLFDAFAIYRKRGAAPVNK
jgi:hypothetical protein